MAMEAGKGEHHVYRILSPDPNDQAKLTAGNHYIGVEAVAWYINKESSWFSDRMASGTLEIKLSNGLEKYQAALGTFELTSGSKTAPVFERPVLNARNYRGGAITFAAMLTAIKKDTIVGGLLKSAANASLGIVSGMVETATLAGPVKLLTAAGEDLISGVQKVLSDTGEKREPIFSFNGLEYSLQPDFVIGPETFLLLHRGANLEEKKLKVVSDGQLLMPSYDNKILDDGAWLLLRIRRADEYTGVREWFDARRSLRGKVEDLVKDVTNGFLTKDEGLAQLKPSTSGDKTVLDEYFRLRSIIRNDGVLSEREAGLCAGQLNTAIVAAKNAITQNNPEILMASINIVTDALAKGERVRGALGEAFEAEATSLAASRSFSIVKDTNARRVANLSGNELFASMKYMPTALERSRNF